MELEGTFRIHVKVCCCCTKLLQLFFRLTPSELEFYKDQQFKNVYLKIPRNTVIAINKRQIDRNDLYKLSIYYQLTPESEIQELKLKAASRSELDSWVKNLRKKIQPKKYVFNKVNNEDNGLLAPFNDTRKFYISLCHLEYILHRRQLKEFFEWYKSSKYNEIDNDIIEASDVHIDIGDERE